MFNYSSSDDYLEGMMNEAPGAINFTMFLTLFGERLQGTDPEDVIKNAFGKKIHFFYFLKFRHDFFEDSFQCERQ